MKRLLYATLLIVGMHSPAFGAPGCGYLGHLNERADFNLIFQDDGLRLFYEDDPGFKNLSKCDFAAAALLFLNAEEVPVNARSVLAPMYVLSRMGDLPPNHIYWRKLHEADNISGMENRIVALIRFYRGVITAIPKLKELLR